MLTTTKCGEQEMNIFQNSSFFFFFFPPNKGIRGAAERAPARQEPAAPTAPPPPPVHGLTTGRRARMGPRLWSLTNPNPCN